jgi:hypothetical protein
LEAKLQDKEAEVADLTVRLLMSLP